MAENDLLVTNIGLLATPQGTAARPGAQQGALCEIKDAAVACAGGRITYAGPAAGAPAAENVIDAAGALVIPGLVDCHTHLVFGGWRQNELDLKLAGVPYLDILKAGGGILSTVNSTRAASFDELYRKAAAILAEMRAHGVSLAEAKSGYGLDWPTEEKQLRVIKKLAEAGPLPLVATFLGAHALPVEFKADRAAYIDLLCGQMLPAVAAEKLAAYCDVFCEEGAFTAAETEEILRCAARCGLGLKVHADEIESIGGAQVAAGLGAASAEHLLATTEADMAAMAAAGVVAVLLPATSFYLDKPYAKARAMLEKGLAVAVGSDFNPGSSPSCNLQFALNLACLKLRLTPAEALCAGTLNAAAAIGMAAETGSVEVGKRADMVIWDAEDLPYLFYRYGSNLARATVVGGAVTFNPAIAH